MKEAILHLSNDQVYKGKGHGKSGTYKGELVFTTAMTGYVEALTDPSYQGQILIFSYPLIGNYGVNKKWIESNKIQVNAIVLCEMCEIPVHYMAETTLEEYLLQENIGAISGIDTRQLIKSLRNQGSIKSVLTIYD